MTRRTLAGLIALPLVLGLLVVSWVVPLPYSVYSPGPTIDVLGNFQGKPVVRVHGHRTYPTRGELRMTTVSETTSDAHLALWPLMMAWKDRDSAVVPFSVAHPDPNLSAGQEQKQSIAQMATSQDVAIAAALEQLGYHHLGRAAVATVEKNGAAASTLKPKDLLLAVDGRRVGSAQQLVTRVQAAHVGRPLRLRIKRGDTTKTVTVTPKSVQGKPRIGIGVGETYDFPFKVGIDIDPKIGGPSAGLMMSLSVYDTLTKGDLADGSTIAGTGTIADGGAVGPIGGIQQKVAAANHAGAKLFLVPADNCSDVQGADAGDMRLVKVTTMKSAIHSIRAWTKDSSASLPTCGSDA